MKINKDIRGRWRFISGYSGKTGLRFLKDDPWVESTIIDIKKYEELNNQKWNH